MITLIAFARKASLTGLHDYQDFTCKACLILNPGKLRRYCNAPNPIQEKMPSSGSQVSRFAGKPVRRRWILPPPNAAG